MSLLKAYLRLHEKIHPKTIGKFGPRMFEGLHPKNVFHFRSEFFIENVTREDVVVDIACGTGLILHNLARHIQKGFGIEYSPKNVKLCKLKHSKPNLEFIEGDLYHFDYAAFKARTHYTTAVLSHILEHVEKPTELLQKIAADKVLICVPSQENWYRQLLIHLKLPYKSDPSHYREYTRPMLRAELEAAGYQVAFIGFNSEGEIVCKATLKN